MDTRFLNAAREALKDEPPYTPKLIGLESRKETALVMRGGDLASFRKADLLTTASFEAWENGNGIWVVVVAFQVANDPQDPLEGEAYLSPRLIQDRELMVRLSKQETFPLVFFSADFCDVVSKRVPWPEQHRKVQTVRKCIEEAGISNVPSGKDKLFDKSKSEFQSRYTTRDILEGKPGKDIFLC